MIRLLAKLHDLDGRWLYAVMLLVLIPPLAVTIPMPPHTPSSATLGLHDAIETCPEDKVVWIDSTWDMGSKAECRSQIECIVRHLCRKGVRFVVTSVAASPFAPKFARDAIEPIAEEAGYVYGHDWVNAGYKQAGGGMAVVIDGLCRDFQRIYPADDKNTPMADLPLMARVRSIEDVHLVCCITYAPSPDWISFVKGQYGTPVGFACMSIMAPNYFTFLDSGQLCGMLVGNRGAAEYEALGGYRGEGTRLIMAASFGVCVIIGAALLGNIGMWARRRIERGSE
jgi:hypothetical protein